MKEDIKTQIIEAQKTLELRQKILLPHLSSVGDCCFSDDTALGVFHLGAYLNEELIGIASFYPEINQNIHHSGKHPYRLRQMGVLPEHQKKGVGQKLLETGIACLQLKGCELLWCHARKVAYPFYKKMGFQYQGEVFEIPQIGPHRLMAMDLPPMD